MGQYNPHAPYILGQEWVPIRNAHYRSDGVIERGYAFTIDAITTPVSGAFYVNEPPETPQTNACDFISVYPSGREMLTGPVKKLVIPASAVAVTNPGSVDITNGVAALLNANDKVYITFSADTGIASLLDINFDVNTYAAILLGKRILDVRVLYSFVSDTPDNGERVRLRLTRQSPFNFITFPQQLVMTPQDSVSQISESSITEMNIMWDLGTSITRQRNVLPWRFQELNRMRSGAPAGEAITVTFANSGSTGPDAAFLGYTALEITYCEETRVLYGGFRTIDLFEVAVDFPIQIYKTGAIATQMYNPVTFTPGATLPAGEYVTTIYHRDMSSDSIFQGTPKIHAVREYYQLPNQRTRWIRQTTVPGQTFTVEDPDEVLTQITLHTATQIVTGVHPYGTSAGAPVYGTINATQSIEDNPANSGRYTQIRYYARRFGNTTVPLTFETTGGDHGASISVADFDALPEIVDGWREVNLQFPDLVVITPSGGTVDLRWRATGELAGNQWQVLVASGPTGAWQPNPAAAATGPATYWAPLGSQDALVWQSPSVSGTVSDTTSDAVLILSQDPPTVTGFALSIASQSLAVALDCMSPQGCIPSGLSYVTSTWSLRSECDTFDRPATANGFGTSTSGHLWAVSGGLAANYATDGEKGIITIPTGDTTIRSALLPNVYGDFYMRTTVAADKIATGQTSVIDILLRAQDPLLNLYRVSLGFTTGGNVDYSLVRVVGGAGTASYGAVASAFTYLPGTEIHVIAEGIGSQIRVKIWVGDVSSPPDMWSIVIPAGFETTYSSGQFGVRARLVAGTTTVNPAFYFDDFSVTNPTIDTIEIQRRDSVDTEWQTVLNTTNICTAGFSDYEARVGVLSEYRIRTLNALDFAGPWVTGSATVPSPGVAVGGRANSVLIFTSNAQPASNLAYTMQWEGQPIETFSFPEADTVSLQRLFGRDFFLALRPLERGGDRFSRTILVNNAAIALPSLANFRGLRDLAWADLDYVCVRDELGNRWFAAVIVPDGEVRGNRTIYLARIDVVEVTDTPSPLT
jgi:hypothetical protein